MGFMARWKIKPTICRLQINRVKFCGGFIPRAVILASGATERSIAFANNDRPGVMLGGATRQYAQRFGVATGRAISFFTNNDSAWHTANILKQKGVEIAAMIDVRDIAPPLSLSNTAIIMGAQVKTTQGPRGGFKHYSHQ